MGPRGCVSPACPGWDPGIVGWASVPANVFPRGQHHFRPHQQWCEGPAGLQPGIICLFILVRLAGTEVCHVTA